jgi:hypothetical protein
MACPAGEAAGRPGLHATRHGDVVFRPAFAGKHLLVIWFWIAVGVVLVVLAVLVFGWRRRGDSRVLRQRRPPTT